MSTGAVMLVCKASCMAAKHNVQSYIDKVPAVHKIGDENSPENTLKGDDKNENWLLRRD